MTESSLKTRVRSLRGDRVYLTVVHIVMAVILVLTLYPIIYVISSSFSCGFILPCTLLNLNCANTWRIVS